MKHLNSEYFSHIDTRKLLRVPIHVLSEHQKNNFLKDSRILCLIYLDRSKILSNSFSWGCMKLLVGSYTWEAKVDRISTIIHNASPPPLRIGQLRKPLIKFTFWILDKKKIEKCIYLNYVTMIRLTFFPLNHQWTVESFIFWNNIHYRQYTCLNFDPFPYYYGLTFDLSHNNLLLKKVIKSQSKYSEKNYSNHKSKSFQWNGVCNSKKFFCILFQIRTLFQGWAYIISDTRVDETTIFPPLLLYPLHILYEKYWFTSKFAT